MEFHNILREVKGKKTTRAKCSDVYLGETEPLFSVEKNSFSYF